MWGTERTRSWRNDVGFVDGSCGGRGLVGGRVWRVVVVGFLADERRSLGLVLGG